MGKDSYFVPNIYAYSDMSKCFSVFVLVSVALGGWALASSDHTAILHIEHPPKGVGNAALGATCDKMNSFLQYMGFACMAEAVLTVSLAMAMWHIMKNAMWGCFSLINITLYVLLFAAKAAILVMGTLWIWGVDNVPCHTAAAPLYKAASTYLAAALVVFGIQVILGSAYLLLCGMMDALHEAIANIKEEWMEEEREDYNNMEQAF